MKTEMGVDEGGCGGCGGCGGGGFHFFKVVLKDDLRHPFQLMLPTKFVMEHGNDLSGIARLRVPGGDSWEVKLRKEDGKVWLQDGWADFIKHYGIGHGHFVVFSYQGGSRFDMVIVDITACEIEYPIKADHGKRSRPADEDEPPFVPKPEEDIDVESQQPAYRVNKRMKNTQAGMFADHLNSEFLKLHEQVGNVAGRALSRATSYRCRWPSVIIVLGQSSVHPNYTLLLPKQFSKVCSLERQNSVT
ncbi:hypothetical protein MLD38_003157 [Melastoma candidum]|uniref:Uncharacterized protein n=1 Tax=Melastoma candidum TaxID=119954 RepID=A0ACB9S0X3_9MYRT|nr:hypothetical protein MLD38_003157 [Melastoma candidum]